MREKERIYRHICFCLYNPATYLGKALAFDVENRATSFGTSLTAGYQGDGLRAWKQTSAGRVYFVYDGMHPVLELNGSGAVTASADFGDIDPSPALLQQA